MVGASLNSVLSTHPQNKQRFNSDIGNNPGFAELLRFAAGLTTWTPPASPERWQ
jgi:hypothetical protein